MSEDEAERLNEIAARGLALVTECSDAHCILRDRTKPSGMRTNGGCRHLKNIRAGDVNAQIRALADEVVRLRRLVTT